MVEGLARTGVLQTLAVELHTTAATAPGVTPWLTAIRREGEDVTAWQFLRIGAVAMPLALLGALAMLWWQS